MFTYLHELRAVGQERGKAGETKTEWEIKQDCVNSRSCLRQGRLAKRVGKSMAEMKLVDVFESGREIEKNKDRNLVVVKGSQ